MTPDDGDNPAPEAAPPASEPVLTRSVTVPNKRGLHARAAARFVMMAERFGASGPKLKLGQSELGRVIRPGGATRRATEPEKTDGSARGSWG